MDAGVPDGGDASEQERSWRAAAGLVGVLAGLIVVVWLLSLTTGDGDGADIDRDSREAAGSAAEEQVEAPTTTSLLAETETEASDEIAPEGDEPAGPFSELMGALMYLSGRHVARVDLATGAVQRVPIEPTGLRLELGALEMLNDDDRTVGLFWIDGEMSAVLVASGADVVPSDHPVVDFWVVSQPDGPDGAFRMDAWHDYGILTGGLRAPAGSEVLAVRNGGVLVIPPVGRTYRPTFDGFEVVSEHRLLAASDRLRVEQRCDDQLLCTVVVVDLADDEATALPDDFVAELADISVSPDSRWLLNDTSPAWLYDRQTERLRLLDGGGYGRPLWFADSVAWLTSDRTPTLVVARLEPLAEGQNWFAVELAGLGADPSPGSSFRFDPTVSRP